MQITLQLMHMPAGQQHPRDTQILSDTELKKLHAAISEV